LFDPFGLLSVVQVKTALSKEMCCGRVNGIGAPLRHRGIGEGRTFKGLLSEMVRESTDESLGSGLLSEPLGQLLIHRSTVTNGHQANGSCFLMNGIDDAKTANAILS
jgi:hypothetical protein